ncbi:ABC transporter substrate-binding protein, partial [Patescibacteria group bacterium]|nr:ABC transporter substrate-binding protein [Patescibacteria group bacterium]
PVTAEAAKETKTIPIVFGSVGDPLGAHFVTSLSRPGGNVTGITSLSVELSAKRLDLLKQLYPNLKRVAVPATMTDVAAKNSFDLIVKTAPTLGVTVVPYLIDANHTPTEVAGTISHKDVDGIVLTADSATWAVLPAYIAQAKKEKLPFAVFDQNMVQSGGLVGYGPEYTSLGGQAADMVKRILDGTSPAVVPVESPEKLILALNLKTAKDLGLVVPDVFLSQVDYLVK